MYLYIVQLKIMIMSTVLTPFQQEAQIAIAKANTLGFAFDFESKSSKCAWVYTEEVNSTLIKSIDYHLRRTGNASNPIWIVVASTIYNFVTDKENGVFLQNLGQNTWNQTEIKEHFVCSIVL